MLFCLLVSAVLGTTPVPAPDPEQPGQQGPATALASEPPKAPTNADKLPSPDRWLLMKTLQGTWLGDILDRNRMQVTGWTDSSFTASTDAQTNLPMGFNHRANQFLVQQNWLRFERSVVTSGTTEPTFGFRSDWIL